ncbi:MAG: PqqD family protein [Candidatus Schekmanbacteria bacterium]|nr:PqqD family protein [Candidatus Schekmanbacteria bacterium]
MTVDKTDILDKIPVHAPHILSRIENGKAVIFDDTNGEPSLLNETGSLIWSLCNGNLSVRAVISEMAHLYEGNSSQMETEIIDFISLLSYKGIITLS